MLLAKASRHLAAKEVEAAAAVYKGFERRGAAGIPAAAATNLSFLYLLEGDLTAAAHYTDLALKADRCASEADASLAQCAAPASGFTRANTGAPLGLHWTVNLAAVRHSTSLV